MNSKAEQSQQQGITANSSHSSIPTSASSNKLSHTMTSNSKQSIISVQSSATTPNKHQNESVFQTLKRFVQDLNIVIPWMLNQLGSVVFFILLSTEPISIASPVANALTFLFTAITSYTVFNERVRYPWLLILGTILIIGGTALCMM